MTINKQFKSDVDFAYENLKIAIENERAAKEIRKAWEARYEQAKEALQ